MKSNLNIWNDVKSGRLAPEKALAKLAAALGGTDTITFRRVKRFITTKKQPKLEKK